MSVTAAATTDAPYDPDRPWGREDWVSVLAGLVGAFDRAAFRGGSPARPWFPDDPTPDRIHGLEGFARMSVALGAWLGLSSNPTRLSTGGPDVAELVVRGLLDGTAADGPFGWGPATDRDQRIVEAAEIATAIWLGRERLVPRLGPSGLAQVLDWLDTVHGRDVYDDNWVLFPSTVAAAQRALGRTVPDRRIDDGIDRMLDWYRGDGFYSDGGGHAFDAYCGWAVHWHLLLWARMDGARRPARRRLVEARFRTFLEATLPLVSPSGARPLWGRSLGYRFAAAAPLGLAALLGLDAIPPGVARRAATAILRHDLAAGAIDPGTGWLRRGVAAERPEVCERYISSGAVAWAAHAFVALGLPQTAPFWSEPEAALPAEEASGTDLLRGPGFVLAWDREGGTTSLHSALADHPDDIPGHDYTPYYGKLAYRSHFPFTVRAADGRPGPDDAVTGEDEAGRAHRSLVLAGDAGPGWLRSRYRLAGRHALTTVVLPAWPLEVRLTRVVPGGLVRLVEGGPALGVADARLITRGRSDDGRVAWITDGSRTVAIRALLGYDAAQNVPTPGDVNLTSDHAEQPVAREPRASAATRIVASAVMAGASRPDVRAAEDVRILDVDDQFGIVNLALGADEEAWVALGVRRWSVVDLAGHRVRGDRLGVVRARRDGSSVAGDAIGRVEGIVRLDRPGPVSVARTLEDDRATVEVVTMTGVALDRDWAGAVPLRTLETRRLGRWVPVGILTDPGVVPAAVVRRLRRASGRTLVELRLR